jgi:hypothetical protein
MGTADESATTGKALVRAVTQVGESSPAGCGSAQESGASEAYALSEAQAMACRSYFLFLSPELLEPILHDGQ